MAQVVLEKRGATAIDLPAQIRIFVLLAGREVAVEVRDQPTQTKRSVDRRFKLAHTLLPAVFS